MSARMTGNGVLAAAVLLAALCAAVAGANPRAEVSRARALERTITSTLNAERAAAGARRLGHSRILTDIAEHRARIARAHGDPYPGYDLSGDLAHYHVCFHAAREWEFAFNATSPRGARRAVRTLAARIAGYRQDLLRSNWRQLATGVAVAGRYTYLIEDFAALCR